jgi:ATF/CREB family transcription factor
MQIRSIAADTLANDRVAALKCRQRKKQWLANLQTKVEEYTSVNESLNSQISQLREEVVNLKTLLLAHKDCNISQQQAMRPFMQQPIDSYNPQMHSYGMPAPPLTNPQIMAGQGAQRPYS